MALRGGRTFIFKLRTLNKGASLAEPKICQTKNQIGRNRDERIKRETH